MSNELLKDIAAGTTATGTFASTSGGSGIHTASENGNGGLLNPEQSARFLDYMFDATVIGKVARTVRMKSDTTEIDRIGVGEKLMKLATEGSDTATNSAVTFSKISLNQAFDDPFKFIEVLNGLHPRGSCAEFSQSLFTPQKQFGHHGSLDLIEPQPVVSIVPNFGDSSASLDDCNSPDRAKFIDDRLDLLGCIVADWSSIAFLIASRRQACKGHRIRIRCGFGFLHQSTQHPPLLGSQRLPTWLRRCRC